MNTGCNIANRAARIAAVWMAAACATAAAQQSGETPGAEVRMYDTSRADHLLEIKAVAGTGISSAIQNYASVIPGLSDLMISPGCMVRAGVDVEVVLRRSLAIGTGISIDANAMRYAMSIVEGGTGTINSLYTRSNYYCLTVPVYMQWRLNLARRMRWNIECGMYMSFGTGGRTRTSGYTSGQNSLGQPVINHTDHEGAYYDESRPLIHGVKSRDWGARIATGLTYRQRYSLTLAGHLGIPNLAQNHGRIDVKYHNVNLAFELGVRF